MNDIYNIIGMTMTMTIDYVRKCISRTHVNVQQYSTL